MWLRRLRHGYTKFGYATYVWLRHRLRQTQLRHIVTPYVVTPVTPRLRQIRLRHIVTPRGYAGYAIGYAKFGYATWLRRLRQTRLRHIVTPRGYAGYATVTPNSVTPYSYTT